MAVLKRWKFGRSREQLDAGQSSLLEDTLEADIAAIEVELKQLAPATATADATITPMRQQPNAPAAQTRRLASRAAPRGAPPRAAAAS